MNNTNNDLFGEFVGAPNIPPPPVPVQTMTIPSLNQSINNFTIDNNMLYKKLIELEIEINNLKVLISNIKYPQPIYYPQQPQGQIWQNPTNSIWKGNQTQFR